MSLNVAPVKHSRHSMSDDEENTPPQRAKAASQACETCRTRKVKCDEERPKCGVCLRLNAKCEYREPKPTKKDKTLVWMSDTLKSIEKKVDFIVSAQSQSALSPQSSLRLPAPTAIRSAFSSYQLPTGIGRNPYGMQDSFYNTTSPSAGRGEPSAPAMSGSSSTNGSSLNWIGMATSVSASGVNTPQNQQRRQNKYQVELRKVLTWPAIRQMLNEYCIGPDILNSQWEPVEKWLTRISDGFIDALPRGEPIAFESPSQPDWNTGTMFITMGMIQEYTNYFFLSYHCLYPILDEDYFRSHTILTAANGGFDRDDQQTTLILLVMALGEVSKVGVSGKPIRDEHTSMQTGVRGGDRRNPPGLSFIYEAQQRIGTAMTSSDTTVLHCYILFSLYYAQVSRNTDYWRMAGYATQLCSVVVKCVENWDSFDSDIISRAYWMCVLLDGGLVTELGLPPSGINDFDVGLPTFLRSQYSLNKQLGPKELRVKTTFLAQITLRAELNRINDSMRRFDGSPDSVRDSLPTYAVTEAHLASLRGWRAALPTTVSWSDDDCPKASPAPSSSSFHIGSQYPSIPNSPQSRLAETQHFLSNMRTVWSFEHLYPGISKITPTFDGIETVLEAATRTSYKYAQYLIFRPYLYKVLHSGPNIAVTSPQHPDRKFTPQQFGRGHHFHAAHLPPLALPPGSMELPITTDDVIGALHALKACTLWYLTHPVLRDQRRLIPHLYEYSHTMFGILLLFVAAERSSVLNTGLEAAERGPSAASSSGMGFRAPLHSSAANYATAGSSLPFSQTSQPSHSQSSTHPSSRTAEPGCRSPIELALLTMGSNGQLEEFRYLREAIGLSKDCFLGWMGDMQVVHPIARWCWGVCRRVYGV